MYKDFRNYEIFEDGRIWSYKSKKFLKPITMPNGYQTVNLVDNEGKKKMYYIHRVIYESVTGAPIPKGYEINHISEAKDENMITNLQLISHKENCNYGSRTKRSAKTRSKQVGAFKDGELVFTFSSTKEAGRQGFNQGAIAACCRNCFNREGNNIYKGFEWRYL